MSTASRRLETLSLLQSYPGISATRLGDRLGVTERTVRRDIAQLRELGYRIDAEAGRTGGYRLAHGRTMPPLLLDADEVTAVALGLRTAVAVEGLETAAVTALAKLTQVVPSRWQGRLAALAEVQALPGQSRRRASRDVFIPAALACRASEAIRIRHRRHDTSQGTLIDVQPYRLMSLRRRCRCRLLGWPGSAVRPAQRRAPSRSPRRRSASPSPTRARCRARSGTARISSTPSASRS